MINYHVDLLLAFSLVFKCLVWFEEEHVRRECIPAFHTDQYYDDDAHSFKIINYSSHHQLVKC